MREIRFRAWDKILYKMWYLVPGTAFVTEIMRSGEMTFAGQGIKAFELRDTELMQYTGLKDKNGKDVFEGDVVKTDNELSLIYEVVWREDRWVLETPASNFPDSSKTRRPLNLARLCLVIGDIYQNPEVLK